MLTAARYITVFIIGLCAGGLLEAWLAKRQRRRRLDKR